MAALFRINSWAGLRLKEAYTLRADQIDLAARVMRVNCSKQWHGRTKLRNVPIRPELLPTLAKLLEGHPGGLLLPFWDGDDRKTTGRLSARFASLFDYAGCDGLTEHDLRHEATCRWFELKNADGGWMLRAEEINTIMGWEPGSAMAQRYASFRAEDLAARMYGAD